MGAVELLKDTVVRDFTINVRDDRHGQEIVGAIRGVEGVRVVDVSDRTFLMHPGGRIGIRSKMPLKTRDDLSMAYAPGVARVCLAIKEDREYVIPSVFNKKVVPAVAREVMQAAQKVGVARRRRRH